MNKNKPTVMNQPHQQIFIFSSFIIYIKQLEIGSPTFKICRPKAYLLFGQKKKYVSYLQFIAIIEAFQVIFTNKQPKIIIGRHLLQINKQKIIQAHAIIIIMIIRVINKYQKQITRSLFTTAKINKPQYSPPPSQFQDFKKHLEKIDVLESKTHAAELLARLQADQQIYQQKLLSIEEQIKIQREQNLGPVLDLFNRIQQMQAQIQNQITQNKEIEARCLKEIENIKVFGITKIAKEVIETVDHINQAISIINSLNNPEMLPQVTKLTRILAEIHKLLNKYEIHQFNPKNEPFNPNEQESIGNITAEQPSQKNIVAQVKRTGFKIKDRLLRSASVIIYT